MNTLFVKEMKNKKKFLVSNLILVVSVITFGFNFYYMMASVIIMVSVSITLLLIANRSFGGGTDRSVGNGSDVSGCCVNE